MTKKVIVLVDQPLDARNRDRFGIDTWIQHGWVPEVWDLSPLYQPAAWRRFTESAPDQSELWHHPVFSERDLHVLVRTASLANCYIDLAGDALHASLAKAALARAG